MTPIRLLAPSDLPALLRLSRSAGWNQTAEDWLRVISLEPLGCFGIEAGGAIAATATVVRYAPDLAWIGMVLTSPESRGRGLARRLVQHAIHYSGDRTIRLDASEMGIALYRSLDFVEECAVERWERGPWELAQPHTDKFQFDRQLDRDAFGADRSALVEMLSGYEAASIPQTAFAMGRPGANARYFGPCVSLTSVSARRLAEWFIALDASQPVFWDLFPHHRDAVAIAAALNFHPVRRLTRMSLNARATLIPDPRVYAIAGFEYG